MSSARADLAIDVSDTQVFDYRREVIVELYGRTADGEFEVVSYAFRQDPNDETRLRSPEIRSEHEATVRETLADEGYDVD